MTLNGHHSRWSVFVQGIMRRRQWQRFNVYYVVPMLIWTSLDCMCRWRINFVFVLQNSFCCYVASYIGNGVKRYLSVRHVPGTRMKRCLVLLWLKCSSGASVVGKVKFNLVVVLMEMIAAWGGITFFIALLRNSQYMKFIVKRDIPLDLIPIG